MQQCLFKLPAEKETYRVSWGYLGVPKFNKSFFCETILQIKSHTLKMTVLIRFDMKLQYWGLGSSVPKS